MTEASLAPMFLRSAILFGGSVLGLLGYEYFYHKKYNGSQVPISVGFSVLFVLIVFRVTSLVLGALIAGKVAGYSSRPAIYSGGLLGLWLSAIGIQFAQNFVRRALGEPTLPILYINKDAFRLRRRR